VSRSPVDAARVKRFMERWRGDAAFRHAVSSSAADAGRDLGVDPHALRPLWDPDAVELPEHALDPAVRDYRRDQAQLAGVRDRLTQRLEAGSRPYARWRGRQIGRCMSQSYPPAWINPHYPFAIELAKGCSIQCNYCCFDAPRLSAVARHDRDGNARLFREILETLRAFFGEAADSGFLYWATDPLDNPDYERYVEAFRECLGSPPRTTTAAWYRDIPRTQRLLALGGPSRAAGVHRLSINSLAQLRLAMRQFTPEELAEVGLVAQNPGSTLAKCAAGRGATADPTAPVASNTDISGFILNLVERSVQMITPCSDLARWPLGYAVYRRGVFADAQGLQDFLRACERDEMGHLVDDASVPRLRDDVSRCAAPDADEVVLATSHAQLSYDHAVDTALLRAIDGTRSLGEVVRGLMTEHDPIELYARFERLRGDGLFEQLPAPMR